MRRPWPGTRPRRKIGEDDTETIEEEKPDEEAPATE